MRERIDAPCALAPIEQEVELDDAVGEVLVAGVSARTDADLAQDGTQRILGSAWSAILRRPTDRPGPAVWNLEPPLSTDGSEAMG